MEDSRLLARVPSELAHFLIQYNGLIAFRGALHIRGTCETPDWHSLEKVWFGDLALHRFYRSLLEDDVPFAQDCLGDQYILREGLVHRLRAEYDDLEPLELDFEEFLEALEAETETLLPMDWLDLYEGEGERLAPGQLLSVYPPICLAADSYSLAAVPVVERIAQLVELAAQIRDLRDEGSQEIEEE